MTNYPVGTMVIVISGTYKGEIGIIEEPFDCDREYYVRFNNGKRMYHHWKVVKPYNDNPIIKALNKAVYKYDW